MRSSLSEAISKDPQFALGYVGIADCYNMLASYGFSPPSVASPKAKMRLDRALQINNKISELHSNLGWYYWVYEYDYERAEASFRKALNINPSSLEARKPLSQPASSKGESRNTRSKKGCCGTCVGDGGGAGDGTRTRNLLITNQLLYQLSYAGKNTCVIDNDRV